jgi:hypothetical protein
VFLGHWICLDENTFHRRLLLPYPILDPENCGFELLEVERPPEFDFGREQSLLRTQFAS